MMPTQDDPKDILGKISWFFRGKRFQDSSWSWVVCIAAAACYSVNLGFALSFGVLFPVLMEYFDTSRKNTALIGSVALAMTWFASPVPGYLCDRFGCRITNLLGSVLCITGLVSTSFVQSLTHMYFTYSLMLGLGTCFISNSCFLVVGQYFKEKLSVATGILTMGGSLGVLYTGPLLQVFLDAFGWRYTLRLIAATFALVFILSLTFNPNVQETTMIDTLNNREDDGDERSRISLYCSVWTFPTFTVVVMSLLFGSFGMYIPYINLVKYCEDLGITAQKASRLFIFIGLASTLARLITGRLCNDNRVNPVLIYQASMLLGGLSVFMLPLATKYWGLITFSAAYGVSDGVFVTTHCFILLSCVDAKRRTASFCIANILNSLTVAAGGPIAGLIAEQTGNYVHSFYMTGAVLLTSFLIPVILIVIMINRRKSKVHPQNPNNKDKKRIRKVSTGIQTQETPSEKP